MTGRTGGPQATYPTILSMTHITRDEIFVGLRIATIAIAVVHRAVDVYYKEQKK